MADWMRNTVESTLGPAIATVIHRIETRTPTGGRTFTWATGAYSYCSIGAMSASDLDLAGRMEARATVACRVSAELDVDTHDRVSVTDAGADELDGTWEVTAVLTGYPMVDRLLYLNRVETTG
jgi:head-tail adaptor